MPKKPLSQGYKKAKSQTAWQWRIPIAGFLKQQDDLL
jgi:hypothetical protein